MTLTRRQTFWALTAVALPGIASAFADTARDQKQRRARLSAATSWGYQLRIRDLAQAQQSNADLLVIDHGLAARSDDGKLLFNAGEIAKLKVRADGRPRLVLCYFSIGEAEQYRFYWQAEWCKRATAPAFVGAVNPSWPGNYPARFWDPAWQKILLDGADSYLAKIKAVGFDGVYLDRADVWSEWTSERATAEREMIAFLGRIATAARAGSPAFLVIMQNAEELLQHKAVRQILDGVAKEDLLYGTDFSEQPNSQGTIDASVKNLKRAQADGMPLFAIEYLNDPALVEATRKRLQSLGMRATFGPRLLDALWPDGVPQPAAVQPQARPHPPRRDATWAEGGPTCLLD